MSSGGGGTNTVQTNSAPPQYVQNAYQEMIGQANQDIANAPTYQPYQGNMVAGLSPDQQTAIGNIQGAQGIANPYINAAAQEIGNSTTPLAPSVAGYNQQAMTALSGAQQGIQAGQQLTDTGAQFTEAGGTPITAANINQFESPYTQQVVGATEAQFNNQNAQQQQQVASSAAQQGAYGGDREAVAQGITAGQQQLAEAPVISGLENTGFQTALTAAEQQKSLQQQAGQGLTSEGNALTQSGSALTGEAAGITGVGSQVLGANEANNWLASQAGYGMSNLGNEAENTDLTGASALMGVGGTEQQLAQEQLNVPYENYLGAQAYPYQQTQFLEGAVSGTGNAGGSSSTTSPGPSAISQLTGTALTGAGLVGMTGGFGSSGWLTGAGGLLGSTAATDAAIAGDAGATAGFGALAGDAGALLAGKDGGGVPGRATGGNILPFPQHRVNRGIAPANDDMMPHIPQRAAGGISIPQLPTNAAASTSIAPNGVAIPQLPTGGGGIAPSGGGMGAVNSYLQNNAQWQPPAPPAPAPAPAPPAPGPSSGPGGAGPNPATASSTLGITPTQTLTPAQINQLANYYQTTGTPSGDPSPSGNPGGPGQRDGGAIRRDDGGDIPDDLPIGMESMAPFMGRSIGHAIKPEIEDGPMRAGTSAGELPAGGGIAPPRAPPSVGITGDNTTDWHQDAALQGGAGPTPQIAMPDTGTGGGIAPPMPQNRPPIRPASYQTAGNGIAPPGPPPPPPMGAVGGGDTMDAGAADPNSPITQGAKGAGAHGSQAPWETLIAAGLGIMGGNSPHAAVNIGKGGLQGLQFGEQQRVREEQAQLRQLQQEDLNQWRQATAGIKQQQIPIQQERADTGQSAMNNRAAYQQGLLAARARGQSDAEFNAQWTQQFKQAGQDLNAADKAVRSGQAQYRIGQGDQRLQQGDTRIQNSQANAQAAQAIRRQALQQTQDATERRMVQTATNSDIHAAASLAGSQGIPYAKALKQIQAGRGDAEAGNGAAPGTTTGTVPGGQKPPLTSIFGE